MDKPQYFSPSALELRDDLRRRRVSAHELVTQSLETIERKQDLGAFLSVNPDEALRQATEADAAIEAADNPQALPLLTGLPTAHKDLVKARGFATTHGSQVMPREIATTDDPVVLATRTAGAITVGKTQVPEFGLTCYSNNLIAPPSRNPYDPSRTSGGSSGGSAAAVAAEMVPAVIASDAGGSIRIPAAACGLVGLKPGRGVVPADEWRGMVEPWGAPVMGVYGPIARTPLDAALFYDAIMGRQDEVAQVAVRESGDIRGLRIGISYTSPVDGFVDVAYSADAKRAVEKAAIALENQGHIVEEANVTYSANMDYFLKLWAAPLGFAPIPDEAAPLLGDMARMYREIAKQTSQDELASAVAWVTEFVAETAKQWGAYDCILTPTLTGAAPLVDSFTENGPEDDFRLQCQWAPQTAMVNIVGVPAITVPVHWDSDGLPYGAHLIGRGGSEIQLLQLAQQLLD